MKNSENLDALRRQTLARIEKTEQHRRLVFVGVAVLEVAIIGIFVWLADFGDRSHLLLFVAMIGIWAIVGLGLVALGVMQRESSLRILAAIESLKKDD